MSGHEKTEKNHKCEIVNGTILEINSLHNTAILKYVLIKWWLHKEMKGEFASKEETLSFGQEVKQEHLFVCLWPLPLANPLVVCITT